MNESEIIQYLDKKIEKYVKSIYHRACIVNVDVIQEILLLMNHKNIQIKKSQDELIKCKLEKEMLHQTMEEIKSEAIKEFAERLKDELRLDDDCGYHCYDCCYECKDYVPVVDNLVKEMTEVNEK